MPFREAPKAAIAGPSGAFRTVSLKLSEKGSERDFEGGSVHHEAGRTGQNRAHSAPLGRDPGACGAFRTVSLGTQAKFFDGGAPAETRAHQSVAQR